MCLTCCKITARFLGQVRHLVGCVEVEITPGAEGHCVSLSEYIGRREWGGGLGSLGAVSLALLPLVLLR